MHLFLPVALPGSGRAPWVRICVEEANGRAGRAGGQALADRFSRRCITRIRVGLKRNADPKS